MVLAIVGWILASTPSRTDKQAMYIQLLVSRVLIGISSGLTTAPSVIYVAEVVHPKLRGRLSIFASVFIAIGILLMYIMGYLLVIYYFYKHFNFFLQ